MANLKNCFKNNIIRRRIYEHHKKTVEAMRKPVESVIGLRMMQRMGWKGGCLGARGNGIVEPIMPTMNHVFKEGLGLGKVYNETISRIGPTVNRYNDSFGRNKFQRRNITALNNITLIGDDINFDNTNFVSKYKIDRRHPNQRNIYYTPKQLHHRNDYLVQRDFSYEHNSIYKIDRRPRKWLTFEEHNALYKIDRRPLIVNQRLDADFRLDFLSACRKFIISNEINTVIGYQPVLLNKEMKFAENAVNELCSRSLMKLGFLEMGAFIGVLEVFRNNSHLQVECSFIGKEYILLTKYSL